jgi:rubrerythrin
VLRDLKPQAPFDYAELRQQHGKETFQTLLAHGKPCATAADSEACQRALREPAATGFGSACHPGHCDFHVVISDARGVTRFTSSADLARFLAPIDTPSEALLMAFANKHWVLACDAKLPERAGADFKLVSKQMIEECPVVMGDVSMLIAADGTVQVLGTTNKKKTNMCVGRRPPGFRLPASSSEPGCATGEYLAASAHLEAASITAFENLATELTRLEAPSNLVRRCRRAASDERRHARAMRSLATRFGSRVLELAQPQPQPQPQPQDAESIARDNAIEGCVRETFGAVVGLYQAEHALDPEIREALGPIARDEMRHAELAWRIAAWAEARLEPEARARIAAARRDAIAALRLELQIEPEPQLRDRLGLPASAAALGMFAALERTLWAAPS